MRLDRRRAYRRDAFWSHPVPALPKKCHACQSAEPIFPFTMAFQPVVDFGEHRIYAFEALVRGLDGRGAQFVLSEVNDKNLYAFDQACRVKATELAASLGMDR
jgi:EAL domain-containing protein (putative c-di-GMP-specific phosphodiesterase class I)